MPAYIQLTQGKTAIVDDEFFEELNQYKWYANQPNGHNTCYAVRWSRNQGTGKKILLGMHREVLRLAGVKLGHSVDHKNGDGLDNQRGNLRPASIAENNRNTRISKANTSGYKGVSWNKRDRRWQAHIRHNGKQLALGYYHSPVEAARAYDAAAVTYHGEFARINFPDDNCPD